MSADEVAEGAMGNVYAEAEREGMCIISGIVITTWPLMHAIYDAERLYFASLGSS